MRRRLLGLLALLLTAVPLPVIAAGTRILLVARDHEEHLLPGFRFAYQGIESLPTSKAGATELDLPPEHRPGQQIKLFLLVPTAKRAEEWFLVNPQVNIPSGTAPAEVVLMRRSVFRQIAAEARDASRQAASGPAELTAEDRKRVLVEAAARHGLAAEQLETALRSFAETQDPKDKGIAAYLEGEFSQAEELLNKAVEKKESDFVEALRYLGASQYEQGKYRAAADTFRKAVALRSEDSDLLSWLGNTFHHLAEWTEAEALLRRALAIDEKSFGVYHPEVASALNDLAGLLKDTNRLVEAETLLRLALAIDEKSFGPNHPDVAIPLSNLALLLQVTNRLAEAEPLLRRALGIVERSFGPDHPKVAAALNNLAQLLRDTNRHEEAEPLLRRALGVAEKSFGSDHPDVAAALNGLAVLLQDTNRLAEAEPLLRRALVIFESSLGKDHPNVALTLNNLAYLLRFTSRLAEAEPLYRRALAISEKSFGSDHPDVAIRLSNLASLLQATNRVAEAEPLMRRALAIDEKSFGPDHPDVAIVLNNLAGLLWTTGRLAEAEPLMRRHLEIFLDFSRRTGHEHPHLQAAFANYQQLLQEMGKSDAEIDATIEALVRSAQ
jgi:tetratricopeptide (TPR) repeat protein